MKGAIGTSMGGPSGSRKWALKLNLRALIHAKDILKLLERGEPPIRPDILEACHKALSAPSLLESWEKRKIHACWTQFAEAGKLRGIRQPRHSVSSVSSVVDNPDPAAHSADTGHN